jgi:hypothetical protein
MYGLFIDFAWELLQRYSLRPEKRNEIEHNDTVHRRFDPMNRYGNRPQLLLYSNLGWSQNRMDSILGPNFVPNPQTKSSATGALLVECLFFVRAF